jgi:hypothetical protein
LSLGLENLGGKEQLMGGAAFMPNGLREKENAKVPASS